MCTCWTKITGLNRRFAFGTGFNETDVCVHGEVSGGNVKILVKLHIE
jgi:hypothetical protein